MGTLSKFGVSLPYNCYEIAHPWTHSCPHAWAYLFTSCLQESLKIYSLLYLFAQLGISRKVSLKAFGQTIASTVQSSIFLSYNVFFFLFLICAFRYSLRRLYLPQSTFTAGFVSSFLAILLERPARRRMLSLYMLNICSEVLFNFLANRALVPVVPFGDILLFSAGLAGHSYLISDIRNGRDPISAALRLFVGGDEFLPSIGATSSRCRHAESSCVAYALRGFVKPFFIGYLGRCALASVGKARAVFAAPSSLPFVLRSVLTNGAFVRQGAFLGAAVLTFRAVRCMLRSARVTNEGVSRAAAGALAGAWVAVSRNTSLSLYLFWKAAEGYYMRAVNMGMMPRVPLGTELMYAFACAVMLFNAIMEPHNIRPSYLRFLDAITGTGLAKVNRHPIEMLGFHSTTIHPNYFPYDIDLSKVHRRFIEQVVVWS